MNASPDNDIKKIYEKSVRLLNDKQAHLMEVRQVLKKAVIRLSFASRCDNKQVNAVLDNINSAVEDHVDLDTLNTQLDNLFVLINHADYHSSIRAANTFYQQLHKDLKLYRDTKGKNELITVLKTLSSEYISDADLSKEIVEQISTIKTTTAPVSDSVEHLVAHLNNNSSLNFSSDLDDPSEVLDQLSIDLTKYIHSLSGVDPDTVSTSSKPVGQLLNDIVNQLTLPDNLKDKQMKLSKALLKSDSKDTLCTESIGDLVGLVNQSIASIQSEKQELETYLTKINSQLADIESFMHVMKKGDEDKKTRDSELTDSVENSMLNIEQSVSESTDLEGLKKNLAETLVDIRKHVEEYKQANVEKEDISTESYSQIISELSKAQKESKILKEQLKESKTQMLRDTLTGIPNRLAYNERVSVEVHRWKRTKAPLCLAVWDIDHFKNFNDTYGHIVGDKVLQLFSEIIQSRVRKVDHFARIGGEEFVLLMPDTPLDIAVTLNNKLRVLLEDCNFHYEGKHCPITASVGIAEFSDGDDAETVLNNADKALYVSKENGRNRCTAFEPEKLA